MMFKRLVGAAPKSCYSSMPITQDIYERNKDIIDRHIPVKSNLHRLSLIAKNAVNAFVYNAQHLSDLGCLSSYSTLLEVRERMMNDPTGRKILEEKPRINHESANIPFLLSLDKNSFGYHYGRFMGDRDFSSEERPTVTYMPDFELAYVYQRYKEIHDFIHTLLGFDVTVYDEIVVKWFEMIQLGFPSTGLSSFVGPLKFSREELSTFNCVDLPMIIAQARQSSFIMNVYFENEFETNIHDLRKRMNLTLKPRLNY